MAEWSKAAVSKTVNPPSGILGFESPSLRNRKKKRNELARLRFFICDCTAPPQAGGDVASRSEGKSQRDGEKACPSRANPLATEYRKEDTF